MSRLVFDVETDGIDATKIWCIVAQDVTSKEVYSYGPDKLNDGYDHLASASALIGHNIIGYDIPVIRRLMHKPDFAANCSVIDTLVLSRLFNPAKEGGHSLNQWGHELGFNKLEFKEFDHYSEEMLEYCIRDVELNTFVYHQLKDHGLGFSKQSIDLEHEVARIMKEQEEHGFFFDSIRAELLYAKLRERMQELDSEIKKVFVPKIIKQKLFPRYTKTEAIGKVADTEEAYHLRKRMMIDEANQIPGVRLTEEEHKLMHEENHAFPLHIVRTSSIELNISSRKQIGEYLQEFGWKPTEFTVNGRPIVNEKTLSQITDIPEAELIKEHFLLQKREGQIRSWLEKVEDDDRVHGFVIPNGTITGRMTHRDPNMAQVPSVSSPYGKECRACWTVPRGYKLVGIDASGLELRMLAHYMDDEDYTNEIINGDIHTANQQLAGLESRNQAKTFIYALLYGAGDEKLGSVAGGGRRTGEKLRQSFFDNLPSFANLKNKIGGVLEKRKYLKGLDGRKLIIRSEHSALNTLLQGAGAIVMKQALVLLDKKIRDLDAHFVANVHDEWQIEVREDQAEQVGQLGVEAIREAGIVLELNCPLDGEYKIGDDWSETH
jgi:DNA polymerase I-like protein with 3'-5' exonuclease and polymerase domains